MRKRTLFLMILAAMIVSLGAFTLKGFGGQERTDSTAGVRILSEKIDQVLKNQQDIIERLKDIRIQQDVIRVRASQR
ncbi:MAG: hypothetical protein WC569_05410 [Candidatus Omnitrophota bacterium]